MKYTKYGEFARVLRIRNHQRMDDMAEILGTTKPYLSLVENGVKYVPLDWVGKLIEHYQLNAAEQDELLAAVSLNRDKYVLETTEAGPVKRRLATELGLAFPDMDEATAARLLQAMTQKN